MDPEFQPYATSFAIINSANYIRGLAETKQFNKDDYDVLNKNINVLVMNNFKNILGQEIVDEVKTSLKGLVTLVSSQPDAEQNPLHIQFKEGAVSIIKAIESDSLPFELISNQAYHGDAITKGMTCIRNLLAKDSNAEYILLNFVKDYCDSVLSKYPYNVYLLRGSSRAVNGEHNGRDCQFFTLSFKRQNTSDIRHVRLVYTQNPAEWCTEGQCKAEQKFGTTYSTLNELIYNVVGYDFAPVSRLSQREEKDYFVQYVTLQNLTPKKIEGEAAEKVFADDPILKALTDSFTSTRFVEPVITPEGFTFSREPIVMWLKENPSNPYTRAYCNENMLIPNYFVAQLIATRVEQLEGKKFKCAESLEQWKMDPILQHFADPITLEMIRDPVVANDGFTYDRESLLNYLQEHENRLPSGKPCSPPELIPNRVAKEVLALRLKKFSE